jgi:hypothetical protein
VNLEIWRFGDLEKILRFGDLEIWRFGDLEIWRFGDLEIWRVGDFEICKIWKFLGKAFVRLAVSPRAAS